MPRQGRLSTLCLSLLCSLPILCTAEPAHYGTTVSIPLIAKEPDNIHGLQVMFSYDPQRYQWRQFNIYFDGGFTHFYTNYAHNSSLNIISAAPVIHYTFRRRGCVLPYLELSVGPALLDHTRFGDRNLGIHFSFQDRMGIGAFIGPAEHFSIGIHSVHYSNAHLSSHNSGVSVPLELDLGYRF